MWSLQKYHQLKLSRQTRSPRAEGTCAKDEDPWKDTDAESSPGANGGGLGTTAQRHFDLHDAITEKELGGASMDEVTASDAFMSSSVFLQTKGPSESSPRLKLNSSGERQNRKGSCSIASQPRRSFREKQALESGSVELVPAETS